MKRDKRQQTRKINGQANASPGNTLKCDTCGKPPQNRRLLEGIQRRQRSTTQAPQPTRTKNGSFRPIYDNQNCRRIKKLNTPLLGFGKTVDSRAYSIEDPPTEYPNNSTKRNGTPTEDWLRHQAIATIKRHKNQKRTTKRIPRMDQGVRRSVHDN